MGKRGKKGSVHLNTDRNGCQLLRWTYQGQRQSEKFTTIERMKEIEYLLAQGINPKKKSTRNSTGNSDLPSLLDELLKMKRAEGVGETSLENYQQVVNRVLRELPYTSTNDAQAIRKWSLENLPPSVCKRWLQLCSTACRELTDHDPFNGFAKRIKEKWEDNPNPRVLSEAEIEYFMTSSTISTRNACRLLLLTGMRPSEAYGLKWSDIKDGYILIQRQCREMSKGVKIVNRLKTQKYRKFPLYPELREFLDYLSDLHFGLAGESDEWILVRENGTKDRYYRLFDKWKRIMPEDTTPYNCRDTFITNQIKRGTPASLVASWVGNSVTVIEKHYQDSDAFLSVLPR